MRVNTVNRVVILGNDGEYFLHHRRHLADRLAALGCRLTVITGGRAARGDDATGWDSIQMPIDRSRRLGRLHQLGILLDDGVDLGDDGIIDLAGAIDGIWSSAPAVADHCSKVFPPVPAAS